MPIETLDDVITELADKLGVYGACDDNCTGTCRMCWEHNIKFRILRAIDVERKLYGIEE